MLRGRSKGKKPVIEMTTTKPIEIRMVGIDKKIAMEETIKENMIYGQKSDGTRSTGGVAHGKNAFSLDELCDNQAEINRGAETNLAHPSSQTMEKYEALEKASFAQKSFKSHKIKRLTLLGDVNQGPIKAGEFQRDLLKEYSPSKQAQMRNITHSTSYDKIDIHSIDFRAGRFLVDSDCGYTSICADREGSIISLSGQKINLATRQDLISENRSKLTQTTVETQGEVLKIFSDGRLVFQEKMTNTIYLYDAHTGHVVKSIKGKKYKRNLHETRIALGFTHDEGHYLWRRTETTLSMVNLQDFEIIKEINQFWPSVDEDLLFDSYAIGDDALSTVICINKTKEYGNMICHYFGNGRIRHANFNEIYKNGSI